MKTITLKRNGVDTSEYIKRTALETDAQETIKGEAIAKDQDNGQVIFLKLDLDFDNSLYKILSDVRYDTGKRTQGLKSTSRIIGYSPRSEIRGEFCTVVKMATEQPKHHAYIANLASKYSQKYKELLPDVYTKHLKEVQDKVLNNWIIPDSPFTSGIINKNNALNYHLDRGNFKGVFSCMLVINQDVGGGNLVLPEYNVKVKFAPMSLFLFDGQSILHGVTPIEQYHDKAARFSVVFYSLKRMCECLSPKDELNRIREKKTQREIHRSKVLKGEADIHESLNYKLGQRK